MKKLLLTLSVCFAACASSMAQYTEDFESTTGTALPAAFVQTVVPTSGPNDSVGYRTGPNTTFTSSGFNIAPHTRFICLNDDKYAGANNSGSFFATDVFSLSGLTSPYLSFQCAFLHGTYSGVSERAEVWISTDGGTSYTMLDTLKGNTTYWWEPRYFDLSAYGSSSTVRIGFKYKDNGGWLFGLGIDDISVYALPSNSLSLLGMSYNSIQDGISTSGSSLIFGVQNTGSTVTSFDAQYTINGGTPVTQTFTPSPSLAPYATGVYTFTTGMAASAGTNTVIVTITNVNTVANTAAVTKDTSTFLLASASVQRQGLVEEFSSSTCAPCASFNSVYDPLCISLNANTTGSNFNVIKYQMNWPSPGNDQSYNGDGNTRKGYYGVTGIPDHYVNGQPSQAPSNTAGLTAEANASHANNAFMDMSVTYKVDSANKNLSVSLSVTPRFTKTGNYHVYVALADKHYQNQNNTTGQLEYYHVMRKMLPDGNGTAVTSWTDGTAQTFNFNHVVYTNGDYTAGTSTYPAQMSNKFWNNPLLGSELIAFVEEDGQKSVMQSILAFPVAALEVSTLSKVSGMNVYPNPAHGIANLSFNLGQAGNVQVKIMDFAGKQVGEVISKEMSAGQQTVAIPTGNIAPGNYVVVVSTETGNNAASITIE